MNKKGALILGLIFATVARPQSPGRSVERGEEVTQLLAAAKGTGSLLRSDISTLDFFAAAEAGLEGQSAVLEGYQEHIVALQNQESRLEEMRKYGSRSQQVAIDRIIPVIQEFVSSAKAAIRAVRTSKDRSTPEYRDYCKLNADLAGEFANAIGTWVDYAGTRGALDRVAQKFAPPSAVQ